MRLLEINNTSDEVRDIIDRMDELEELFKQKDFTKEDELEWKRLNKRLEKFKENNKTNSILNKVNYENLEPLTKSILDESPNPQKTLTNIIETFLQINKECRPFITQLGGGKQVLKNLIYRGIRSRNSKNWWDDSPKINTRLSDRKPKDTPKKIHNKVNELFIKRFGKPYRNGIFATNNRFVAASYGKVGVIMPVGNFSFLWSEKIDDFYGHIENVDDSPIYFLFYENDFKHIIKEFDFGYNLRYIISNVLYNWPKEIKNQIINILKYHDNIYDLLTEKIDLLDESTSYYNEKEYNKSWNDILKIIEKSYPDFIKKELLKDINLNQSKYIYVRKRGNLKYISSWDVRKIKNDIIKQWLISNKEKIFSIIEKVFLDLFSDKNLPKAIQSRNEIMFWCEEYYWIDQEIIELIKDSPKLQKVIVNILNGKI